MEKVQKRGSVREIDYLKIARILLSRWYLLVASILTALLIAYAYLWYTPKTYATSGILKFEEKKSELSDLVNAMSSSGRSPANLQSEKFILQSRNLLLSAIKQLDYNISFYISGRMRNYDLYPQKPLQIMISKFDSLNFYPGLITFKPIDRKTFSLSWNASGKEMQKTCTYNTPLNIGHVGFTIKYAGLIPPNIVYLFRFNTPETLLERVNEGLRTSEAAKNSNIVNLQQTDSNPRFAADILNAIMTGYLSYDRNQKAQSATQMIRFINEQQEYLSSKVKSSESSLEKYKQRSGIMNVNSSAGIALSKVSDLESQRSLLKIQLMAIDQLKKQVTDDKHHASLNFNLEGNIDPLLGMLISKLNDLLNDKNILLKTYNSTSETVEEVNRQITQVKNAALQNISASNQRIQKNIAYINTQLSQADRQVSAFPAAEKDMISLLRDFEINEKVYSFLSEKKLEAQINRSAILPGATIIEPAQVNYTPISPNVAKIYRSAIILGLLMGLGIIVFVRVLNPFIYDKESVENMTTIPIVGMIRKFPDPIDEDSSQILALTKPRSIFAESVRSVRTNLNFLASEKMSKVICITSDVAGEGKSFVALNLSSTLALIDKKVILIGADLRRPKLHRAIGGTNDKGLSNYLVNQSTIDEIIQHTDHKNLDFISSGPIPPNPAELLHNERLTDLLAELKKRYEVIMIDTAPVGLVSDSIPLICRSDINLFVIRYGKSRHNSAMIPQALAQEYNLNNMAIVLNAFEENILQSGYYKHNTSQGRLQYYADYNGYQGSGYFEDEKKLKWWSIRR
ncbi:MAG: polysaccharide biosynthesis tyrosine autokinase [Candidatus Pedobacter colombiensis]|uniref:non-specific protein-tyrosine kinase n=1 Tax=Candidatus Pedobacter colombiensis TaxID=3121371 RepID=A0AAJ5W9P8_9SPHI|nr:tyrosine-protein kinase family protein [Pedobacter sp.]WEK19706.1 MAG: polysaccharide biosynthesis tyrosine autokinase [Pedobacter sp.]